MTTTPALNDDLVSRLMDYGLTLDEHVVICYRRAVDEAASALEAQSKEIEALRAALERVARADFLDFSLAPERSAAAIARTALKGA